MPDLHGRLTAGIRVTDMTTPEHTEPQHELLFDVPRKHGIARLGLMANESWNEDPRRSLFTLARYKFVAKLLSGKLRILDVGCGKGFLLHDFTEACPGVEVAGLDISRYAIDHAMESVKPFPKKGARPRSRGLTTISIWLSQSTRCITSTSTTCGRPCSKSSVWAAAPSLFAWRPTGASVKRRTSCTGS